VKLVVLRICRSKAAAEGLRPGKLELRRQGASVRMRIVAAENREDKPVMASPARRRPAQRPANREVEEKEGKARTGSPAPRRPAQRLADRQVEEKEVKAPTANPAGRREVDRLLRLSPDKGNQNVERKKARKNHRRQGHSNLSQL